MNNNCLWREKNTEQFSWHFVTKEEMREWDPGTQANRSHLDTDATALFLSTMLYSASKPNISAVM